jgi:hypothetical protein
VGRVLGAALRRRGGPRRQPRRPLRPALRTWRQFAALEPELAAAGEALFRAFTLVFLATLRPDGAPRVHPVTITLRDGGLYIVAVAGTPKALDLARDGRYALHSFPHLPGGTLDSYVDDEFTCAGRAVLVEDRSLREAVAAVHNDTCGDDDSLFRLDLDRAHHKTREAGRAVYRRWRAPRSQ